MASQGDRFGCGSSARQALSHLAETEPPREKRKICPSSRDTTLGCPEGTLERHDQTSVCLDVAGRWPLLLPRRFPGQVGLRGDPSIYTRRPVSLRRVPHGHWRREICRVFHSFSPFAGLVVEVDALASISEILGSALALMPGRDSMEVCQGMEC